MKQKLLHSFTLRVCLLVAMFASAVSGAWAESYEYTFESNAWSQNGSATLNNVSWTLNMEGGTISTISSTQGMHFGTNKSTCNSVTISSSGISGTITSVKVEASRGSSLVGTLGIKVGSTAFKVNNSETNALTTSNAEYDFTGNDNGNIEIKWTTTSGKGAYYIKKITITYSTSGNLTTSDLAITGAPVALSFDLYNNTSAQTVSYTTSSTGTVTVSGGEGYVTTSVDATNKTITVTPTAVTPSAQTITVSQAADETYNAGEVTFTVFVDDSTPIPTHTATFNVNGVTSSDDVEEGADITFPADPADQEGKVFMGWTTSAIEGTTNEAPTMVTSATMGNADVTYYAVFANRIAGTLEEVTDVLTNSNTINSTSSSYSDWTTSDTSLTAAYAGNSGGDHSSIQLRSNNNNSGIVTTTSGGKATKVTVEWNSNTTSGRTITIYGKSSKFEAPTNLYSNDILNSCDELGTIVCGTSTELTLSSSISSEYLKFIGIRSKSGALYLDKVSITWSGGTPDSYSDYCTTVVADTREEAGISFANDAVTKEIVETYTGQALTNPNSLTVSYTSSNEEVATVNAGTGAVTIVGLGETTITATFAGDEDYKAGSASYTLTVQDTREAITLSFAQESVDVNINNNVAAPTLNGNTGNGTVTFASNDEAIATVNASTGEVTGVADGTTTITATVAATNAYQGGTATFTVNVIDPNKKGTATNPYTIAEAINAIDNSGDVTDVYVAGIVCTGGSSLSSGSLIYWISDDGTETNKFEIYKGKGNNGADFTSTDDIQAGDVVVVKGNITKYYSTYEFSAGSQLVSLVRKQTATITVTGGTEFTIDRNNNEEELTLTATANSGATVVFTVDTENTTISGSDYAFENGTLLVSGNNAGVIIIKANAAAAGEYKAAEEVTITVNILGVKSDAVIVVQNDDVAYGSTYTIDTDMIEGGDITVTSSNEAVATVNGLTITPVAVGTTTITVATAEDATYNAGSETFTLTVTAPEGKTTAAAAGFVKVTSTSDITDGQYLIVYEDGGVAFNGGLETLDNTENTIAVTISDGKIEANNTTVAAAFTIDATNGTILSASGKYIGQTSDANGLATNDATSYTNTISFTGEDANIVSGGAYLRYNSASNQLRFRYYKSASYEGQKAIQLYKLSEANLTATLNASGYATYCSEYPLDFSDDSEFSAWEITGISGSEITFNQITGTVKGGTGVFLKGTAGETVTLTSADNNNTLSDNLLEGIMAPTYVAAGDFFGLKGNEFVPVNAGTVPSGKALLPAIEVPNNVKAFTFVFVNTATGMRTVETVSAEDAKAIFNLAGQRLSKTQRGINIVNGKKVVVK